MFSFYMFVYFMQLILLLISRFIALWSEKNSCYFNFTKFVETYYVYYITSTLKKVSLIAEKNVDYLVFGWNVL